MSRTTIRRSRAQAAALLSAGTIAVLIGLIPGTAVAAEAVHKDGTKHSLEVPAFNGPATPDGGDDGRDGPRGPAGPQGPPGQDGDLDTYVVTGNVASSGVLGTQVTSTASCLGNDVALGGGYSTSDILVNVTDSAPVFVGTGPATGWYATATIGIVNGSVTAYAVCHDEE